MIYHYSDLERDLPAILSAKPPVGWDLPLALSRGYKDRVMLAAVAINTGYYIAMRERGNNEQT